MMIPKRIKKIVHKIYAEHGEKEWEFHYANESGDVLIAKKGPFQVSEQYHDMNVGEIRVHWQQDDQKTYFVRIK